MTSIVEALQGDPAKRAEFQAAVIASNAIRTTFAQELEAASAAGAVVDTVARAALRNVLVAPRSGVVEITNSTRVLVPLATVTLLPGDLLGGSVLTVSAQLAKYAPNNAGWSYRISFRQGSNKATIVQNELGASMHSALIRQTAFLASDLKSFVAMDLNGLGTGSINTAGYLPDTGVTGNDRALMGARAPGVGMLVSYSSPPTVETPIIDFSQPYEIIIEVGLQGGDKCELVGALIQVHAPVFAMPSKTLFIWGDSLTEGTGQTPVNGAAMDVTSQLRRLRSGWAMQAKGLGGQKSKAIIDRLIADQIHGKSAYAVLWIGTNDFDDYVGNPAGWLAAVRAQIDRALAYRGTAGTLICNLTPRASWEVGSANYNALLQVNAGLVASYGTRVVDLFTAVAIDNGKVPAADMVDEVHMTNAAYARAAAALDSKMTALDWA